MYGNDEKMFTASIGPAMSNVGIASSGMNATGANIIW